MKQKAVQFLQREPTIWGPISLVLTLAIAVKTAIAFDLAFISAAGLFLSAIWHMRGCCYSLALLAIGAALRHAFLVNDHLWQLGIEGSIACAFFIIALAFEQGSSFIQSLQSQMDNRNAALENLEEEIAKIQETSQEHQIAFQEKVATLQKELEDLQAEHSSILILNEVLRKTTARHSQEANDLNGKNFELHRTIDVLKSEYETIENELSRLKNTDAIVLQNKELIKELNAARYEKGQTHLINETLARLYAIENLKAKEANQEASSLAEQLSAARKEMVKIALPLEEQLQAARKEIDSLKFEFEKTNMEANRARDELRKLTQIQMERNFLKERLEAAMAEIAHLQSKPVVEVKPDPKIIEELAFAQQRIKELSQVEPLFKQLKKQFEEKTQVLHQVRSDLFKADTELQRIRMEKESLELNPIPKEVDQDIQELSRQVNELEEENLQLQELISVLSGNSPDAAKRKKKVKTQSPPEQDFLF